MPQSKDIHIDKALENVSSAYQPQGLIAGELSPSVMVIHNTDKYFVYSKDNFRIPQTLRSPKAASNVVDWNLSSASYCLEKHALKDLVSDDDVANADKPINLRADATELVTGLILLKKESTILNLIGTKSNWANETSMSSTQAWNANTTLSNPVTWVDSAASAILKNSGKIANVVVIDNATFIAAKEHVSILDRIKYTSPDSVTPGLLAKLFNVEKVLVSKAVQNTGEELAADSMSFLMTDCAWVGYVERSPGVKKASALYTFTQDFGGGQSIRVKSWRDEELEGEWIEATHKFQHKIVASDCAYYIGNTIQ